MIVPIVMVIGYSFQDNVILNKSPDLVGVDNYVAILTDPGFWKAPATPSSSPSPASPRTSCSGCRSPCC